MGNLPVMSADQMSIGEMLSATVPMARTLNLEFLETTPEKAVVALPDQSDYHNHVGGPHAGAMFTLGESATVEATAVRWPIFRPGRGLVLP